MNINIYKLCNIMNINLINFVNSKSQKQNPWTLKI